MPGVTRKNADSAGGKLIEGSSNVFVNGNQVVRIGDAVESHGDSPHNSAKMIEGSSTVFVNGIAVCRSGDEASCGHSASGSSNVIAG